MKIAEKEIQVLEMNFKLILYKEDECDDVREWFNSIGYDVDVSGTNGTMVKITKEQMVVLNVLEDEDIEVMRLRLLHELFHFCYWGSDVVKSDEYGARLYVVMYQWCWDVISKQLEESKNNTGNADDKGTLREGDGQSGVE